MNAEEELRDLIAYAVERHYLPICVCSRCENEAEGRLVSRIIEFIKTGEPN